MRGFGDKVWLIGREALHEDEQSRILFNPLDGRIEGLGEIPDDIQGKELLACFEDGWFILADAESKECFLLDMNNDLSSKIDLPKISEPFESLGTCNMSSPPTAPDCIITFVCFQESFLLFCRPHVCRKEWTKLTIGQHNVLDGGTGSLIFKGKLYISTIAEDLIVVDVSSLFSGNVEITRIDCPDRRVQSQYDVSYYPIESCGELFLVSTMTPMSDEDGYIIVLTNVEVHWFDFSEDEEGDWKWVESIGDRAFFLGANNVALLCQDGLGVEHDSIYYVSSCYDGERLYKISLIDQTITYMLIPPEMSQYSLMWMVPTRSQRMKHEMPASSSSFVKDAREDKSKENDIIDISNSRPWVDLPIELVESFTKHLSLTDMACFRTVCKSWCSLPNPVREAQVWLMYCAKNDGTCKCNFFDPFNGEIYTVILKHLRSINDDNAIRLLFSKDGWVVVSFGEFSLILLNPFMRNMRLLPQVELMKSHIAFSYVPSSPDCVVLSVSGSCNKYGDYYVVLDMIRPGDEEWCHMKFDTGSTFFVVAFCHPVFFRGEFYILGTKGGLGVFNPDIKTWRFLEQLTPIYSDQFDFDSLVRIYNLVELRGELMAVITGIFTSYVHVFKLDMEKMTWVKLDDLGDAAVFLAHNSSLSRKFSHESPGNNKIHFPKLHDGCKNDKGEFFCMETQTYTPNFHNTKIASNSVWLEPKLDRHI